MVRGEEEGEGRGGLMVRWVGKGEGKGQLMVRGEREGEGEGKGEGPEEDKLSQLGPNF
jgi:hypothetical protein